MKTIFSILTLATLASIPVLWVAGCGGGDDNPVEPEPVVQTILKVIVRSSVDSSLVNNSNVVLFQAETSEALLRDLTDTDGAAYFECEDGNYFVSISAQGYYSVPPENIAPLPFFVAFEETTVQDISLNVLESAGNAGYVEGYIEPAINNFLVLAESTANKDKYATVSGPDGFFIIYNLPYGNYELEALKSGYKMNEPVNASISSTVEVDTVQIQVSEYLGSVLTGSITFLASENSTVDITLLDPETRAVIPGLTVMSDSTRLSYKIDRIPDGDYIAWASFQNDGYVIDPDWVFKNPGGLDISFATADTLELNFSVTDVINLVSPTNPADSTFAFMANSQVPIFRWEAYPSAKEYFIEVKDLSGNIIWGGIDADGTAKHGFIDAAADSVIYSFDNLPGTPALIPGKIYQWKLWADKGTQQNGFVEQLISSSEDLRGIFQVPENPPD